MPCHTYWSDNNMPCYDPYNNSEAVNDELRKSADAATRAACDLRTILRRGGKESDLCQETLEWIKAHDEFDAYRIKCETESGERDQVIRNALNKLTMDERRALGL